MSGGEAAWIVEALINDAMATGPVDSCREDPKKAATTGGRKAAYSPKTAGSPASSA